MLRCIVLEGGDRVSNHGLEYTSAVRKHVEDAKSYFISYLLQTTQRTVSTGSVVMVVVPSEARLSIVR